MTGNEDVKAELEERIATYDMGRYWNEWHEKSITRAAHLTALSYGEEGDQAYGFKGSQMKEEERELQENSAQEVAKISLTVTSESPDAADVDDTGTRPSTRSPSKELYNPYEGKIHAAKQLSESLEDFLSRLIPSKTDSLTAPGGWIRIANPYSKPRTTEPDIVGLREEAQVFLSSYEMQRAELEHKHPNQTASYFTKTLVPQRTTLESSLRSLAKAKHVNGGKWLLFCSPERVDNIWADVARSTWNGRLGYAAKVAVSDAAKAKGYGPKEHLICIYTKDFEDKADVRRVLEGLRDLGILKGSKGIYYKTDMYTYLDLSRGNDYDLQASLYRSSEFTKGRD